MLLSIQQQFILDVIKKLGCLRISQLLVMVREKFRQPDLVIGEDRLEFMLRQLRAGTNDLRIEEDMVLLPNEAPDSCRLEAIDVMLEITGGNPLDCRRIAERPFLLRFSVESKTLRLFSVAELAPPFSPEAVERCRTERIIWISASGVPPEGLILPRKHFFAIRNVCNTHRFYGSQEL